MGPRRLHHVRAPLLGAALLLLLVAAAAGLTLAVRPTTPAVAPLDPNIPNEQALINAGLSGTPGPGQPAAPVVVDRVLVDGAATYVQYHLVGQASARDFPMLTLSDDQGTRVNAGGGGGFSTSTGWTLPFPLPSWVPWQPPVIRRGYYIVDAPLPATAHAAVLRLDMFGRLGPPTTSETIRVPMDLRALSHQHVSHSRRLMTLNTAHGLTADVEEVTDTHLVLDYSPFGSPRSAALVSSSGRATHLTSLGSECGGVSDINALSCRVIWIFPPQRRGARLTLIIPAFELTGTTPSSSSLVVHGPWRIPFVVP